MITSKSARVQDTDPRREHITSLLSTRVLLYRRARASRTTSGHWPSHRLRSAVRDHPRINCLQSSHTFFTLSREKSSGSSPSLSWLIRIRPCLSTQAQAHSSQVLPSNLITVV